MWVIFFTHNSQIIGQSSPKSSSQVLKRLWVGKKQPDLTQVFTFQLIGLALCGHTLFCGDKGKEKKKVGWRNALTFQHSPSRKGKVGFSNTCSVWSHPGAIAESSFWFFLLSLIYFTNYLLSTYHPNPCNNTAHHTKVSNDFKNS